MSITERCGVLDAVHDTPSFAIAGRNDDDDGGRGSKVASPDKSISSSRRDDNKPSSWAEYLLRIDSARCCCKNASPYVFFPSPPDPEPMAGRAGAPSELSALPCLLSSLRKAAIRISMSRIRSSSAAEYPKRHIARHTSPSSPPSSLRSACSRASAASLRCCFCCSTSPSLSVSFSSTVVGEESCWPEPTSCTSFDPLVLLLVLVWFVLTVVDDIVDLAEATGEPPTELPPGVLSLVRKVPSPALLRADDFVSSSCKSCAVSCAMDRAFRFNADS
mmetsp:Transcript_14555/g.21930  ORF Transcript_14555/g.21930 Transcript_14555/m.21930 type:complete len:275 (+) Transcript_14555:871-1695(+)